MPADTTAEAISKVLHEISRRADTSYVIVAASALEDLLEIALLAHMRDLSNSMHDRLFTRGPLSRFAAKIDLAYALKIIDENPQRDFHAIRELRNAFAHAKKIMGLESKELQPIIQKLHGWRKGVDAMRLIDESVAALTSVLHEHVEKSIFASAFEDDANPEHS